MWQHHNYWYSHRFTYPSSLFAHGRYAVPVTAGHGSLIVWIVAYYSGSHSLKIQGLIGIVALQGPSALYSNRINTVSLWSGDFLPGPPYCHKNNISRVANMKTTTDFFTNYYYYKTF